MSSYINRKENDIMDMSSVFWLISKYIWLRSYFEIANQEYYALQCLNMANDHVINGNVPTVFYVLQHQLFIRTEIICCGIISSCFFVTV